ncbi:MAG: response regulator transcription factor [Melioribacter sp.]|nr:response regulator transcription factor [Melioribacter sp.]
MNVIICTDSQIMRSRLITILSELSHIHVVAVTKTLEEAEMEIRKTNTQVVITAFHNIQKTVFKKLDDIKKNNSGLVVIVLTNNTTDQYLLKWKKAGADYVFDQAMHFTKLIDFLAGFVYKNFLEFLRSNYPNEKKLG